MRPVKMQSGYLYVTLTMNGKRILKRVHRIVATAFLGIPEKEMQVNHKDGNKENNDVKNLEWVTPKENMAHSVYVLGVNGLKGELSPTAKLTNNKAREIRMLFSTGEYSRAAIGRIYGVSGQTVGKVISGKSWEQQCQ